MRKGAGYSAQSLVMDRFVAFESAYLPAYEAGALASLGLMAGTAAIFALPAALMAKYAKKQYDREKAAYDAKVKADREAAVKIYAESAKKMYNVNVNPIPAGEIKTKDALVRALESESKKYLASMKKTQSYKAFLADASKQTNEDKEYYDGGWTPQQLDRCVKIEEGVNGWEETISVITLGTDQAIAILLHPIVSDIADMLEVRFRNYIYGVGTGDGDEGHVYYGIDEDAFN